MAGRTTRSQRDITGPRKASRGKHTWTKHEEELLVDLYEDNVFLYDMEHPDYRKTELKNKKCAEIANMLPIPGKYHIIAHYKVAIDLIKFAII